MQCRRIIQKNKLKIKLLHNSINIWDSGDGGPWEVAFGKVTDRWEDFTITTVTAPTVTLTGFEVGTIYFALVRSYCNQTGEYGEPRRALPQNGW
ncbi:MAG: hypothetical protein IJ785_05405 [Bacteroidales bacterium]|nr:hypothetical protein [Bacteroidales bacterium]